MTDATSETGIGYPSGEPECTPLLFGFMLLDLLFSAQYFVDNWLYFSFGHIEITFFDSRLIITPLVTSNFANISSSISRTYYR
jgi:hypothetical protein